MTSHQHDRATGKLPLVITPRDMQHAYDRREAEPVSPVIPEYMRYRDCWWTITPTGWLRITDDHLTTMLDDQKAKTDHLIASLRRHRNKARH